MANKTGANYLKIEALMKKKPGKRFYAIYESYTTVLNGKDIVEAIKDFNSCYNSVLTLIFDAKEVKVYGARENKKPDTRGYFNRSYFDKDNNLIFNEDSLTAPIVKIKPVKITKDNGEHGYINRQGGFFKCGFECHRGLAKELILSKTITKPKDYIERRADASLDDLGWVKISSYRLHHFHKSEIKLTPAQIKSIINWMEIMGKEQYNYQTQMMKKYDIEMELKDGN